MAIYLVARNEISVVPPGLDSRCIVFPALKRRVIFSFPSD
jgi:hypothetical protein